MIYNRAESVSVWLGLEDKDSGRAIDFIESLLKLEDFDLVSSEASSANEWAALHNLMQRPWFNRRWIVQEISLARHATLFCGSQSVSWQDFSAAVALFVARYRELRPLFQRSQEFHNHPNYLGEVEALGARSLVEITSNLFRKSDEGAVLERLLSLEALISTLTLFEASSPHDTIYSVIWLAFDAEPGSTKDVPAMSHGPLVFTPTGSPELAFSDDGWEGKDPTLSQMVRSPRAISPITGEQYLPRRRSMLPPRTRGTQASQAQEYYQESQYSQFSQYPSQMNASQYPESQRDRFLKPYLKPKRANSSLSAADKSLRAAETQFDILPHSIIVDYQTDVYEVFAQFVDFAVSRSLSLDITVFPWAPEPREQEPDLPSWIPLLSSAPFDKRPGQNSYGRVRADSLVGTPGLQRNYNACGKTKMYPPKGFIQDRTLIVTGFVLDVIKTRKSPAVEGIIPSSWLDLIGWRGPPQPVPDKFWRTLVGDRGPGGQKYPPAYYPLACKWVFEQRSRRGNINTTELLTFGKCPSIATEFLRRVQAVVWNRMLILTEGRKTSKPLLALVPPEAEEGDLICILYGCSVPVVIRRSKKRKAEAELTPLTSQSSRTGSSSHASSLMTTDRSFAASNNPSFSLSRASTTSRNSESGSTHEGFTPGLFGPPKATSKADNDPPLRFDDDDDFVKPQRPMDINLALESQHQYTMIGECYVHGMMAGEAFKHHKETGSRLRAFHLI